MGLMYAYFGHADLISHTLGNWVKSMLKYVTLSFVLNLLIDPVSILRINHKAFYIFNIVLNIGHTDVFNTILHYFAIM